jgi:hypothetical protein
METARELIEQKDRLRDLEGWRVRKSLQGLARSITVFEGNARELLVLLGEYREEHGTPASFDLSRPDAFERYLNETQRLLHNYLAAAESVRNHVGMVQRNHLRHVREDLDSAEYERREKEVFRDPLGRFGRELRHHFLKHQIPETDAYLSWGDDPADRKSDIRLNGSELLAERDIQYATAKEYMQEAGDDILINEFVVKHRERVIGFCEWFGEAVRRRNHDALDEFNARSADVQKAWSAWGPVVPDPSDVP